MTRFEVGNSVTYDPRDKVRIRVVLSSDLSELAYPSIDFRGVARCKS